MSITQAAIRLMAVEQFLRLAEKYGLAALRRVRIILGQTLGKLSLPRWTSEPLRLSLVLAVQMMMEP
jgi:hypothetical protein